jgi:type IV secretory pathway VirB10-like protein
MAGDELRQLSLQRRKAVDALARRAVELGAEHGYTAPDGAVQEVGQTLQTALGDPEIGELVRAGRLTQAVTYGGFGPTDLASALGASIPAKPARPEQDPTKGPPPKLDAKQRRRAEQAAAEARELASQARQAAESAEEEAEAATQRADDLADRVESLRGQLRQAEAGEREAREAARAARKHYQELRQAAMSAEQAATAADQALGE